MLLVSFMVKQIIPKHSCLKEQPFIISQNFQLLGTSVCLSCSSSVIYEVAVWILAGAIVIQRLDWGWRICFQQAHLRGCWIEASVSSWLCLRFEFLSMWAGTWQLTTLRKKARRNHISVHDVVSEVTYHHFSFVLLVLIKLREPLREFMQREGELGNASWREEYERTFVYILKITVPLNVWTATRHLEHITNPMISFFKTQLVEINQIIF